MNRYKRNSLFTALLIFLFFSSLTYGSDPELDNAVRSLRNIRQAKTGNEEMIKKSAGIERAWDIIKSHGDDGVNRIKLELDSIEKSNEKDDFFKLNVSMLLWKISGVKESSAISQIWNNTDLSANYKYVFFTAVEAASTGSPEVSKMLLPLLRDRRSELKLNAIGKTVVWPETAEYIWGAFGKAGLTDLDIILNGDIESPDVPAALIILTKNQYIRSLPAIRKIARLAKGNHRYTAIKALGIFGHPDDFDFLIKGLVSEDAETQYSHLWALYEYDDIRAVPYIIPLLNSGSSDTAKEAVSCLSSMVTFESFEALVNFYEKTENMDLKKFSLKYINPLLDKKITIESYLKLSNQMRRKFISSAEKVRREKHILGVDEIRITRNDFIKMAAEWKKNARVSSRVKGFSERHILSAANPEDIDLLIEIKSKIYARSTFDVSYEIEFLDKAIKLLSRKRYRR